MWEGYSVPICLRIQLLQPDDYDQIGEEWLYDLTNNGMTHCKKVYNWQKHSDYQHITEPKVLNLVQRGDPRTVRIISGNIVIACYCLVSVSTPLSLSLSRALP